MKNQKKTFFAWVKVFLVVAVFLTAGIVGGTKAEAKHTHSYTWKVIKAATCTADGYRNEVCSCGHVRNSQTIPKTPHSYAAATCTKPATCSCGATKGSKLGHSFTIAATCTSPAKCSRSGCNATQGSKLGHSFTIAATCTSPAKCSRSGCTATSGSPKGHSFTIAATCTSPAKCSRCTATSGTPLGHKWVSATCQRPEACERCHLTTGTVKEHDFSGTLFTRQPNCSEGGYSQFQCKWCTKLGPKFKESPARGHFYRYSESTNKVECSLCKQNFDVKTFSDFKKYCTLSNPEWYYLRYLGLPDKYKSEVVGCKSTYSTEIYILENVLDEIGTYAKNITVQHLVEKGYFSQDLVDVCGYFSSAVDLYKFITKADQNSLSDDYRGMLKTVLDAGGGVLSAGDPFMMGILGSGLPASTIKEFILEVACKYNKRSEVYGFINISYYQIQTSKGKKILEDIRLTDVLSDEKLLAELERIVPSQGGNMKDYMNFLVYFELYLMDGGDPGEYWRELGNFLQK